MRNPIDRARLEEAISCARNVMRAPGVQTVVYQDDLRRLLVAAEAHLATLPKTKMVEVQLIARMSADGKAVHFCQPDTPENRHEAGALMLRYGGQLVTLKGVAEVPA